MRKLSTTFTLALAAFLVMGSGLVLTVQQAAAAPGDSVSIAGQILEGDFKISFGGWADESATAPEGDLQITFHNVSNADLVKAKFHGDVVTAINFYNSDNASCNAAMNMTVQGTLDGQPGYHVIFRAGDAGPPGQTTAAEPFDTVRIQLYDQSGELYDTSGSHDFTNRSTCVGTARTGLARGNVTIEYP